MKNLTDTFENGYLIGPTFMESQIKTDTFEKLRIIQASLRINETTNKVKNTKHVTRIIGLRE